MNIISIIKSIKSVPSAIEEIKAKVSALEGESVRMKDDLAGLDRTITDDISERLNHLDTELEETPSADRVRDVEDRIDELECKVDEMPDTDGLEDRVSELEERVSSLEEDADPASVEALGDRLTALEESVTELLSKIDGLLKGKPAEGKPEDGKPERKTYTLKELVTSDQVNEDSGMDSWMEAIGWVDGRHHEEALKMHGPIEPGTEDDFECPGELEVELTCIANREGYRFYEDGTPVTEEVAK